MSSFKSFNLSLKMVESLNKLGYVVPTRIQEIVIPKILKGESLIATSETGSGKTHSFLIPIIERIDINLRAVQAIIITPTRELARQTYDFARQFVDDYPELKIQLLSPQVEKDKSKEKLNNIPHLIIATPGRLLDLALTDSPINMMRTEMIVLDEADMLMDMGFFEDVNKIISSLVNPTLMVFSATINDKVGRIIEKYIQAENYIKIDNMTNARVKHFAIDIKHIDILDAVSEFVQIKQPYFLLIFASKKELVEKIYEHLRAQNKLVGIIHGGLESRERKNMMRRIRNQEFSLVVCSDMAARGIDIDFVSDILNVDLPKDLTFYFHRAGRTGRFDQTGECYTFYNSDTSSAISKLIEQKVEFSFLTLKDGELKEGKPVLEKRVFKSTISKELDAKIKKAVSFNSSKEVRPGYKKKIKEAVAKTKSIHRREIIKKDIKKRQTERAKLAARVNKYGE